MYKFNFNNTFYVIIEKVNAKYLSKDIKYKLTFYDTNTPKVSIIFYSYYELTTFICKLKTLIDRQVKDPYDMHYLYTSINDEYGNIIEIGANYICLIPYDVPSEDDDNIDFYINKINDLHHKFSNIYNITLSGYILDDLIEYIFNILSEDYTDIIQIAKNVFINLSYGDFLK